MLPSARVAEQAKDGEGDKKGNRTTSCGNTSGACAVKSGEEGGAGVHGTRLYPCH